jgi:hypothetical protein
MGLKVSFCVNDHLTFVMIECLFKILGVQKFNGCKLDLGWNCLGISVWLSFCWISPFEIAPICD